MRWHSLPSPTRVGAINRFWHSPILQECIDIARSSNWYGHPTILYALSLAARLHAEEGDIVEVRNLLREAVFISDDVGDRPALMMAAERAIALFGAFGQDEAAATIGGFFTTPANRMWSILPGGNDRNAGAPWRSLEGALARDPSNTHLKDWVGI